MTRTGAEGEGRPVRVGVVGTGWGAATQVPAFRAAGLEIAAIWGHGEQKARRVAEELDVPWATADWRQLVARDDLDLVSVTTPPHTHREISIAALDAGRHVLCEKPTALDVGEAEAMLAAARARSDRLALVDHELRFVPARRTMRHLYAEGFVGELWSVEATVTLPFRVDPDRPWDWWSDREQGGGILGAVGSHLVDFLRWVTGRRIEAVRGALATWVRERRGDDAKLREVTSDDAVWAQLRLAGGARGLLHLDTGVAAAPVHRVRLSGSAGTLVWEGGALRGQRAGTRDTRELASLDEPLPDGLRDDEWGRGTYHLGRSLAAALGGRPAGPGGDPAPIADAADFADGLYVQRVLDAVRTSAGEEGGWVEVGVGGGGEGAGPAGAAG